MRTRGAGLVIVALATGCHTSPVQPCATAGLSRIAPNPQPPAPIPQLDSIFRAAGAEFHVSPSLLSGIGWVETRWQMVQGAEEFPGRPAAFGVMGLRGAALERGAALAGVTIEAARQDPVANIRAAAALLAAYAADAGGLGCGRGAVQRDRPGRGACRVPRRRRAGTRDRKSTRLNSSH